MIHRGEIVEKFVRKSGYSLSKLADKLHISRNTLYNRFSNANLSYRFIQEVGVIINYDFSLDFLEMPKDEQATGLKNYLKSFIQNLNLTQINYVRKRYNKGEWHYIATYSLCFTLHFVFTKLWKY
jgi:transcriptional regulator with XRE-family HTH domain